MGPKRVRRESTVRIIFTDQSIDLSSCGGRFDSCPEIPSVDHSVSTRHLVRCCVRVWSGYHSADSVKLLLCAGSLVVAFVTSPLFSCLVSSPFLASSPHIRLISSTTFSHSHPHSTDQTPPRILFVVSSSLHFAMHLFHIPKPFFNGYIPLVYNHSL